MRIGRRLLKALMWGLVLCLSTLAGGLWFAYWHMTDSGTIGPIIREYAIKYFPGSTLDPGGVHVSLFGGRVVFRELRLTQKIEGASFDVLQIPWMSVRINTKKLAKGGLEARDVEVSHPTLRLRQRNDGTWNLEGLLADPWPGPWIPTPPISIKNATVELVSNEEPLSAGGEQGPSKKLVLSDARMLAVSGAGTEATGSSLVSRLATPAGGVASAGPAILRDVSLTIEQAGDGVEHLKFEGTARGDAFEKNDAQGDGRPEAGEYHARG